MKDFPSHWVHSKVNNQRFQISLSFDSWTWNWQKQKKDPSSLSIDASLQFGIHWWNGIRWHPVQLPQLSGSSSKLVHWWTQDDICREISPVQKWSYFCNSCKREFLRALQPSFPSCSLSSFGSFPFRQNWPWDFFHNGKLLLPFDFGDFCSDLSWM